MTEQEFRRIVQFIKKTAGIDLSQKKVLIAGRLTNYLLRNGYKSYADYMNAVEADVTGEMAQNLINMLTTNHTYFMREFEHLEFYKNVVLPEFTEKLKKTKIMRIWSGASSTGEEPYTIAMVTLDYFGLNHTGWDTRILATDLATDVLEHAAQGIYLKENIAPLPEVWKRRYFRSLNEEQVTVKPELKREVVFRQFNLMDPPSFKGKMHVVFLRNVMIYFDEETKRKLVERIYDYMEPGGYFFIGASEAIDREHTNFRFVRPSIYRK